MTDAPVPAPAAPAPAPANPGKTMGIVALVLSIIGVHLIGIILGFVGLNQSKKAGQKNGFAVAGIIIGFIGIAILVLFLTLGGTLVASLFGGINQVCAELGTGMWEVDGITYTCP
jgi:hypothetical protein